MLAPLSSNPLSKKTIESQKYYKKDIPEQFLCELLNANAKRETKMQMCNKTEVNENNRCVDKQRQKRVGDKIYSNKNN